MSRTGWGTAAVEAAINVAYLAGAGLEPTGPSNTATYLDRMQNMKLLRSRYPIQTDAPPGWSLRCVARCQGKPGQVFDRPDHAYTSIEYIEYGYGRLTIGGKEQQLGAGIAFILPRGVDHIIRCDDHRPWRVLFLDCEGDLPDQLRAAYGLLDRYIFPGAAIAQPIRNLLNFVGDDSELQLRAGQIIHETIAGLHASTRTDPDWPGFVLRAKSFIDANLEGGIKLADVADHVGCSTAHLSRNFRRYVGQPPGDYLLNRRMDLAKALLDATDEPIKAIAQRLGYNDAFAFSHAFKALVSLSPSKWRAQQTGN